MVGNAVAKVQKRLLVADHLHKDECVTQIAKAEGFANGA